MVNKNYNFNQKLNNIFQMEIGTTVFKVVRKILKIYIKLRIYEAPVIRFRCHNYGTILMSLIFLI